MMKPRNYKNHESNLSEEMKTEKQWLSRNAPVFGKEATPEYVARAKAYNEKCKGLGATLMMVVEG